MSPSTVTIGLGYAALIARAGFWGVLIIVAHIAIMLAATRGFRCRR